MIVSSFAASLSLLRKSTVGVLPVTLTSRGFSNLVNTSYPQPQLQLTRTMVTLHLVRHGETEMNKADIVQSRTPGDLTERGIKMAESLGKFLSQEKFHKVYTSDLRRCYDTTLNILKHNHDPPNPIPKPVLRERDYGELEFKPNQTVRNLMNLHGLPNHAVPIPGGEPHSDVMKRCDEFFEEICQLAEDTTEPQNILAVSHGSWILCFLDNLMRNADKYELKDYTHELPDKRPIRNTSRTKLSISKLDPKSNNSKKRPIHVHHVHCVKHLSEM